MTEGPVFPGEFESIGMDPQAEPVGSPTAEPEARLAFVDEVAPSRQRPASVRPESALASPEPAQRGLARQRPVIIAVVVTALVVGGGMYIWHRSVVRDIEMRGQSAFSVETPSSTPLAARIADGFANLFGRTPSGSPAADQEAPSDAQPEGSLFGNLAYYPALGDKPDRAALADGTHYFAPPPGGAKGDYALTLDAAFIATGDLNGDGASDAAVLLKETRGAYVFYGVGILMNWNGEYRNVATGFLGDRAAVKSVTIKDGTVEVELLTHAADDFLCCPTVPRVEHFVMTENGLAEF